MSITHTTGAAPTLATEHRHSVIIFDDGDGHGVEAHAINYEELYNLKGRLLTLVDATFADREMRAAHKTLVWRELTACPRRARRGRLRRTTARSYGQRQQARRTTAEGHRAAEIGGASERRPSGRLSSFPGLGRAPGRGPESNRQTNRSPAPAGRPRYRGPSYTQTRPARCAPDLATVGKRDPGCSRTRPGSVAVMLPRPGSA